MKKLLALFLLVILSCQAQPIKKKYKLVYIEWEDIISTDSGWHTYEEAVEWTETENSIVVQVGYVIVDNSKHLVITESYFQNNTIGTVVRIPKSVIRKYKEL
jgi:hypothetical protein